MAVVINEFEVAPAAPAPAPAAGQGAQPGGDASQPENVQKIEKAMHVAHERRRRLAAY